MTGVVFEIREFSLFDGPGIRSTVFLKGCPLRCRWCHNPEGISPEPEILFSAVCCRDCGTCRTVCPNGMEGTCSACGECARFCPNRARRLCGRRWTPFELAEELLKMKDVFLAFEGGGVTFSGGEPLFQADFLIETSKLLREEGISVAIETSGYASGPVYRRVLDAVDLVYQDLKHPVDSEHRRWTGVSNKPILDNLTILRQSGKPFVARIPLIPTVNDAPETLERFADLLIDSPNLIRTELLPYHAASGAKYALLGQIPSLLLKEKIFSDEILAPFRARHLTARIL